MVDWYVHGRVCKHALCNAVPSAAQHSIIMRRRILLVGKFGGSPPATQGLCSNAHCGYLHVKLEPGARACQAFLRGFCAAGASCLRLHVTPRMLRDLRASRSLVGPAAAVQVHCRSTAALSASAELANVPITNLQGLCCTQRQSLRATAEWCEQQLISVHTTMARSQDMLSWALRHRSMRTHALPCAHFGLQGSGDAQVVRSMDGLMRSGCAQGAPGRAALAAAVGGAEVAAGGLSRRKSLDALCPAFLRASSGGGDRCAVPA